MENIKSGKKWIPTEEAYFDLEKKYRDLENRYIQLYNKYCIKPLKIAKPLTDKERYDIVSGKFLKCVKPITNVRKGKGCVVGEHYWFEYVHDTNDWENPDAEAFYSKLSDNDHYDEVYITDEELLNNFKKT